MDSYSGLPAHLLHHLQPQFHIHPALDPRTVPFSAASYQSLTGTSATDSNKTFPSAFAPPPTKCLKMESNSESQLNINNNNNNNNHHSPGVFYQTRAGSTSPGSGSVSPAAKEEEEQQSSSIEDSETTSTPTAEGSDRLTPEEGRGFRREFL